MNKFLIAAAVSTAMAGPAPAADVTSGQPPDPVAAEQQGGEPQASEPGPEATAQPPTPAPNETPPPPPSTAPSDEGQWIQPSPNGQWVYTQQYGWVFMPYGDQYVQEPSDFDSSPSSYVFEPSVGWVWVASPWVVGWGPRPYFGYWGAWRYHWYRSPGFDFRPRPYYRYHNATPARPYAARPYVGHPRGGFHGGGRWGGRHR